MYAAAAQNQVVTEGNLVPREVAPVVGPSVNFGAGATPADGTNRTPPSSCCPPPSRGGFCSAPQAVWGRTAASPSLSLQSGCESRALHQSFTPKAQQTWNTYYDVRQLVTRLECTDWDNPGLPAARTVLAELDALVDQLLDAEQARRTAAIWRAA